MEAPIIEQLTVGFQVRSLLAWGSPGPSGDRCSPERGRYQAIFLEESKRTCMLTPPPRSPRHRAPVIEQLIDCRVSNQKASGLELCLEAPIIEQLTVGFQVRCLQAWGSLAEGAYNRTTDCRVSNEKASGLGLRLEAPIIEQLTVGFQVRSLLAWRSLFGSSYNRTTDCRVSSEKPSGLALSVWKLL